jgi:hypothetical protein
VHVQKGLRKHASAEGIYFKVAHRLVSSLRCNPTQGIDTAPPICQWRPLSVHFWLSLISHKALPRVHLRFELALKRIPRNCGQRLANLEPTSAPIATHEES